MKPAEGNYEPHLVIRENSVRAGEEWAPQPAGWSLLQIARGAGYYLQRQSSQELAADTVILVAGRAEGLIRASQLGGLALCSFSLMPSRLTGLITLAEQDFLTWAASRPEFSLRIFPPQSAVALRMKELYAGRHSGGLRFRLHLLQLFVEAFGGELRQRTADWDTTDARERLRILLEQTPPAELLEMSFDALARSTHCTTRHLSRIFRDLIGMSFREKRAELRLTRARDLLATSQSKVVEVALESGYKSLSLFNLMFTRRFGTSPGRWREKYRANGNGKPLPKKVQQFSLLRNGQRIPPR